MAFQRFTAEADAAQLEPPNVPTRTPAQLAAMAYPLRIFSMQLSVHH
jgi:hypothetical protein